MGQRRRKRRRAGAGSGATASDPQIVGRDSSAEAWGSDPSRLSRGYARGRERDEAARAALEPLAPGERPRAVTVAAILAALLGAANVALLAAGWEVEGGGQSVAGVLIFAGLMAAAAIGMWRCRYWAVLGFEALLAITLCIAALSLLVASNVAAVVLCVAILGPTGWLFWKLIRVMGRLQAPQRVR